MTPRPSAVLSVSGGTRTQESTPEVEDVRQAEAVSEERAELERLYKEVAAAVRTVRASTDDPDRLVALKVEWDQLNRDTLDYMRSLERELTRNEAGAAPAGEADNSRGSLVVDPSDPEAVMMEKHHRYRSSLQGLSPEEQIRKKFQFLEEQGLLDGARSRSVSESLKTQTR